MYRDNFEQNTNSLIVTEIMFKFHQDFRREVVDLYDNDEDDLTHDEDSSKVDDATGGDEDPTENVENVQLGEKEKVTISWTLEELEFDLKLSYI